MLKAAVKPSLRLPDTATTFVATSALSRTVSLWSVVGSFLGERVLYGAAPLRTASLSASEKKIWVV
jgi:hypothetical protein